jgi:hypothetical protein
MGGTFKCKIHKKGKQIKLGDYIGRYNMHFPQQPPSFKVLTESFHFNIRPMTILI